MTTTTTTGASEFEMTRAANGAWVVTTVHPEPPVQPCRFAVIPKRTRRAK